MISLFSPHAHTHTHTLTLPLPSWPVLSCWLSSGISVVFVQSLIAQVSRKWLLRVWLANELPGRGSVVSRSIAGPCSLIKVTYLRGKMPQHDAMTDERGLASIPLAIKWNEWTVEGMNFLLDEAFWGRRSPLQILWEPHGANKPLCCIKGLRAD